MSDVTIIGAGISGLATALFLRNAGVDVRVLEARSTPGGNVRSIEEDDRIIDVAANGWLNNEPAMDRLLQLVQLQDQTVPAGGHFSTRWVYCGGKVLPVPMGPGEMMQSKLIPWWAKFRLLGEPFVGRVSEGRDETVAEFVSRRLGPAFVDRLVGPMVAGIYAADPKDLSLQAAFPRMHKLESEYRSLILAMLRLRSGGAPKGHLHTLPKGAGQLTDAIVAALHDQIVCGVQVTAVEERRDGWHIHTRDGTETTKAVVLACPAHAATTLVRGVDAEVADALAAIPYAPVAVAVSAYPQGAWDKSPDGFGILLARGESLGGVLGTLFTSNIFPGHSREGEVLLRTIFGGSVLPEAAEMNDHQIAAWVRRSNERFFGHERAAPNMVRVFRHPKGIPQYRKGHVAKVRTIRAAEGRHPGLFFTGNHLLGIGVKDCARSGEETATRVQALLGVD